MSKGKIVISVIGGLTVLLLVAIGWSVFYALGPGGDGMIGQMTLADGTEVRVEQTYSEDFLDPYRIGFYFRPPGGKWGWCYIDHEATRWPGARLVVDEARKSVKVYRGQTLRAEYFPERGRFALHADYQRREVAAPQEMREPSYLKEE